MESTTNFEKVLWWSRSDTKHVNIPYCVFQRAFLSGQRSVWCYNELNDRHLEGRRPSKASFGRKMVVWKIVIAQNRTLHTKKAVGRTSMV